MREIKTMRGDWKHVFTVPPGYQPVCEDGRVRIFPNDLKDLEMSDVLEIIVNNVIKEESNDH